MTQGHSTRLRMRTPNHGDIDHVKLNRISRGVPSTDTPPPNWNLRARLSGKRGMTRASFLRRSPLLLLAVALVTVAVFHAHVPPAAEAQEGRIYWFRDKHLWVEEDDLAEVAVGTKGETTQTHVLYIFTSVEWPDQCAPPSEAERLGDPLAETEDYIGGAFPVGGDTVGGGGFVLPVVIRDDLDATESTEAFAVCIRTFDDPGVMEYLRQTQNLEPGDPDPAVDRGWKPRNPTGERMIIHALDQTGVVNFGQSSYSAVEGETLDASIFKVPNRNTTSRKFVASFNASGGDTADRVSDYTADQDDEFTISEDSRMFVAYEIPIVDDSVCEPGGETFTIDLGVKGGINPDGGMILGEPLSATVTIYDDGDEIPTAPQWAQAQAAGGTLTVEWGSSLCDATGHELEYRSTTTGSWTSAFTNRALPEDKFTDFQAEVSNANANRYYVRVRAKNASGSSLWTYADTNDGFVQWVQGSSNQNSPGQVVGNCAGCGTGGELGVVTRSQAQHADLIAQMREWRNDPQWVHTKAHTDRWDRALLAFGETVSDTSLTAMTAAEAQAFADRGWERWVSVSAALRQIESGGQQQEPANQAPTVSASIADITIVNQIGTRDVSLSGVFHDADGDDLSITAASSHGAVATVSVSSDGSSLTVTAKSRGTTTIMVTASDGNGGTVDDVFNVTVTAPAVQPPPEPDTELSDIVSRYDADGDGRIAQSERQQALSDFYAGKLTQSEFLEILRAYTAS